MALFLATVEASATASRDHATAVFNRARVSMVNERARKLSPDMKFREASELFIDLYSLQLSNAQYKAPRTLEGWREFARALGKLFNEEPLSGIDWWKIHAYQDARARNLDGLWTKAAGANKIIQEVCYLKRVMVRAGAWTPEHEANYIPLSYEESDLPDALTADQQNLWLVTSAQKPEWRVEYLYSIVGFGTAASHVEIRKLQRCDINMFSEYLQVRQRSAKNRYRIRTVPFDPDSEVNKALTLLLDRAKTLGSIAPSHFLFPARQLDHTYNPTKPMGVHAMSKPWHEIQEASGLLTFTPNKTRHTCLTRWAESGMAIHVMMSMAGHINQKHQQHYIAISEQAKKKAVRSAAVLHSQSWGRA